MAFGQKNLVKWLFGKMIQNPWHMPTSASIFYYFKCLRNQHKLLIEPLKDRPEDPKVSLGPIILTRVVISIKKISRLRMQSYNMNICLKVACCFTFKSSITHQFMLEHKTKVNEYLNKWLFDILFRLGDPTNKTILFFFLASSPSSLSSSRPSI
jgi:hypothetical protein